MPAGEGWYYLENLKSGMVMTVSEKGKHDGAEIVVSKKEDSPSEFQLWRTTATASQDRSIDFQSRGSGKVLAIDSGSQAAGARVLLWSDNSENSKRFTVIPAK